MFRAEQSDSKEQNILQNERSLWVTDRRINNISSSALAKLLNFQQMICS